MDRERLIDVDIFDLIGIAWREKVLIGGITAAFAVGSVIYALSLPNIYRAEVVLAPTSDDAAPGGLAALAQAASLGGIDLGGSAGKSHEAIAVLKSRAFTERFIAENGLLPALFPDRWDAQSGTWVSSNQEEIPSLWDGYLRLRELRTVARDGATGLVTVSIEFTNPELATKWANEMIAALNLHLQQVAVSEANRNRSYLEKQISESAQVVEMQQILYRLLENEVRTIMLANGRPEFAFRVVSPALVPEDKAKPSRALICIVITMLGGMIAVFVALARHAHRERRGAETRAG